MYRPVAVLALVGLLSLSSTFMKADTLNVLGASDAFSVLGHSTVTDTGASVLAGDLGLSAGTSITGFPPGVYPGPMHINDTLANTAQANASTAYTTLHGLTPTSTLAGTVGTLTLTPGVYNFTSSAPLTGVLTLDFGGLSNQDFVFQTGSTLTTASDSAVNIINQGENDSIYWAVGSSTTLGTTTSFEGNIISVASDTLNTGATIGCGNVVALNGAVTLDPNTIGGSCHAGDSTGVPVTVAATPEPPSLALLAMGLIGGAGIIRRKVFA